jgi:hypothetical protein
MRVLLPSVTVTARVLPGVGWQHIRVMWRLKGPFLSQVGYSQSILHPVPFARHPIAAPRIWLAPAASVCASPSIRMSSHDVSPAARPPVCASGPSSFPRPRPPVPAVPVSRGWCFVCFRGPILRSRGGVSRARVSGRVCGWLGGCPGVCAVRCGASDGWGIKVDGWAGSCWAMRSTSQTDIVAICWLFAAVVITHFLAADSPWRGSGGWGVARPVAAPHPARSQSPRLAYVHLYVACPAIPAR